MREILFRALRTDGKGLVYGWLKSWKHFNGIGYERVYSIYDEETEYLVIPETVCEYTGLKDKNGVNIFDGDKVKWAINKDNIETYPRYAIVQINNVVQLKVTHYLHLKEIVYMNSDISIFNLSEFAYKDTENYLEVIGNIHENK